MAVTVVCLPFCRLVSHMPALPTDRAVPRLLYVVNCSHERYTIDKKVQNKIIVVTGAGGGIGSEVALTLLKRGARVAALDLKPEGLENLKTRAGEIASNLSLHTANIADREAVALIPDQIIEYHGAIDGLINVAGIVQPFTKIVDTDYEIIERVMNVNFYGMLNMTKSFFATADDAATVAHRQRQQHGWIFASARLKYLWRL